MVALSARSGETVFVEVPSLGPGLHKLKVFVGVRLGNTLREEEGALTCAVQEPLAWNPGRPANGPAILVTDPSSPTLEELWANRVSVEISGPPSAVLKTTITCFDSAQMRLETLQLLPSRLP